MLSIKNVDEALNTFYEIYNKSFVESFPVKSFLVTGQRINTGWLQD